MLSQDRQSLILDIIKEQGSITVTRLTEILETSESTVRRDLSYLANKGKINKVHGGATAISQEFIKLEDNISKELNRGVRSIVYNDTSVIKRQNNEKEL